MFTPETEHERTALKLIAPGDVLKGAVKWGTFDNEKGHMNEQVGKCQGGYLRRFAEKDSLLFVIEEDAPTTN